VEELEDAGFASKETTEEVPGDDAKQKQPVLSAEEIARVEAELAHSRKKSNIQLVFGDDDIPYIVESSGLELVDDDIASAGIDDAEDEVADLEELDDGDLEELGTEEPVSEEPVPERPAADTPAAGAPVDQSAMEDVASRIEFSETKEAEEEEKIEGELEIVSPFATMLSRFGDDGIFKPVDDDDSTEKIKTSGRLEELNAEGMSLVYTPFQSEEVHSPELLDSSGPAGIIEEKDGVNYVTEMVKSPDEATEKSLDRGLKNLVNAVIKKG
jgi:hypothetical protein